MVSLFLQPLGLLFAFEFVDLLLEFVDVSHHLSVYDPSYSASDECSGNASHVYSRAVCGAAGGEG